MVIPTIAADPRLKDLKERLATEKGVIHVSGLWGSSVPMVATMSASRPSLYVTAHLEEADDARDDLEFFSNRAAGLFPAWDTLPGEGAAAGEVEAERLRFCAELHRLSNLPDARSSPQMIVAPIQALMQTVPAPRALLRHTLNITVHSRSSPSVPLSPEAILTWAIDRGFQRLDIVESPGDIAQRGDIVDLFARGENTPFRIQFDGETVESIRRFDVGTQRSIETLTSMAVTAMPARSEPGDVEAAGIVDYLPPNTVIILDSPADIQEMGRTFHSRLGNSRNLFAVSDVLSGFERFTQLHLSRFGSAAVTGENVYDFHVGSLTRFEGNASEAVSQLISVAGKHTLHVVCDNTGEQQRVAELLDEHTSDLAAQINLPIGTIHRGFEWTLTKTVVVPHHEVFRRTRQKRRIRRVHASRPLESWNDLAPGDFVVHTTHGIAKYRGLKKMRKGDSQQQEEFLTLEFADRAVIHTPSSQIELVQKYIGAGGTKPHLSKLGGQRWAKSKQQAADAVAELAESLLRIQVMRAETPGTAYPHKTTWQREFEASFLYEETEDQTAVAEEIESDLVRPRPADRLICGDVGYGKTELAMRAAFKVAEYGRQVAVLVPTTVLAEQHYATFRDRMAEYPFVLGCLSRFRRPAEQKKIVEQARKGQIDIVIGTHRLLSKDVSFANLGLVIIDEEQRFGVEHKERLKAMRETVDVLTLTATPIPRTLHMAIVGIRDISSLQTPPVDRRSIATQVGPFDESLIRNAVLREMNRDGQVYFLHNHVQSIAAMADTVRRIVPEARVVYAHGQMKDGELEGVMHRFVQRHADILVCTTIIESGIDIPSVNTIFINRAHRFGLADLHQLRGRVGRSNHRAYCYLLLSPDQPLTQKAAKRLKTIEEFSELGAGFRIAMRDLEIRGAGNLLGKEQSGHIAVVGYDMYCRLLEKAARKLKDEPDPTPPTVHIDLDVTAHIPPNYISAERSRIEVYRRIVTCQTAADLEQLERDLLDAFGPLTPQTSRLLEVAEIRVHARRYGINSISLRRPDVVFKVNSVAEVETIFRNAPGTVRMPDQNTIHLRLSPNYLEPATLLPVLRRMIATAAETVEANP